MQTLPPKQLIWLRTRSWRNQRQLC